MDEDKTLVVVSSIYHPVFTFGFSLMMRLYIGFHFKNHQKNNPLALFLQALFTLIGVPAAVPLHGLITCNYNPGEDELQTNAELFTLLLLRTIHKTAQTQLTVPRKNDGAGSNDLYDLRENSSSMPGP